MATSTTARKTSAKTPTKTTTSTPTKAKFDPTDLPQTGTSQFRQGGDYKPAITSLSQFAKTSGPAAQAHVKALVHLGWVKPGGMNNASKSPAFTIADNAGLPAEAWAVGSPAAPQISANLQALAELGAPAEALDALWAAYVGV